MATPLALVVAAVVLVVLTNVPLAPVVGAVNVTDVPVARIGLPWASSTVALNGVAKVALTVADCPAPPVATT